MLKLSFCSYVKNELSRINEKENCCLEAELSAIISVNGLSEQEKGEKSVLRITTENAAFARKTYSLFKRIYGICPEVICRKSRKLKKHTSFILTIHKSKNKGQEVGEVSNFDEKKECCRRAYLRGAFLAAGSISDPEKAYHLEISVKSLELADYLVRTINSYELNSKVIKRKGYYVVYLKEGDNIVDFLNVVGAHSSLLEMENIRILKDMRNNVNRIVNCETANLDKTVNASVRQVRNIEYIRDNIGLDNLPENLKQIAKLRLQYSDASLKELGQMLNPPLGKSGVNHRLRKLEELAEEVRSKKNKNKT